MTCGKLCLLASFILFQNYLTAQDKSNIKFGKVSVADFGLPAGVDTSGGAVIIASIGNISCEGNSASSFNTVYTVFQRTRITDKKALEFTKWYRYFRKEEKLVELQAVTYNLENGAVVAHKLDAADLYSSVVEKDWTEKKFSWPAVKAGSIIELYFKIKSPIYDLLETWFFQSPYFPVLWSEYKITIPSMFIYKTIAYGDDHFDVKTVRDVFERYAVNAQSAGLQTDPNEVMSVAGSAIEQHWIKKNVSPLKREPFTTTVDNYLSRVSFQLNYVQQNANMDKHYVYADWKQFSERLMEQDDFGLELGHPNPWMTDELKPVTEGALNDEERAKKIYFYVRDHFSCTGLTGKFTKTSLKDIYKNRSGSVAEINLLLTALLKHDGFSADPAILSTRDNGFANPSWPVVREYDYTFCVVKALGKTYTLDASDPSNGFGKLPSYCYNGEARVINPADSTGLDLSPDSLVDHRSCSVFISNDEKGYPSGTFETILGGVESRELRAQMKNSSSKEYFGKISRAAPDGFEIEHGELDSVQHPEFPVKVYYEFNVKNLNKDIGYFNPVLDDIYKRNPFPAETRLYPVEMESKIDYTYVFTMDIPTGYTVDELPKSVKVAYNENQGVFEYLIQKGETNIQMRVRIKMNKAFFPSDEYKSLRDFFAFIEKKESEQIVFKKKS
jgi:hypothetical protein